MFIHNRIRKITLTIISAGAAIMMVLAACLPKTVEEVTSIPTSRPVSPTDMVTLSPTVEPTPSAVQPDPVSFQTSLGLWASNQPPTYADSSSTGIAISNEHAQDGKHSLELAFDYLDRLKAMYSVEKPIDLSKTAVL
jgi:hypothetical protein